MESRQQDYLPVIQDGYFNKYVARQTTLKKSITPLEVSKIEAKWTSKLPMSDGSGAVGDGKTLESVEAETILPPLKPMVYESLDQYVNDHHNFLKLEQKTSEKEASERKMETNVVIKWEKNSQKAQLHLKFIASGLKRDDQLRISNSNGWHCESTVVTIRGSDVDVILTNPNGPIPKVVNGHSVIVIANTIPFERMKNALNKLGSPNGPSKAVVDCILGKRNNFKYVYNFSN